MKKIKIIVLLLFSLIKIVAQVAPNNLIFQGGAQDGTDKVGFIQAPNNIFLGGVNDGSSHAIFSQTASNIYVGNTGDGISITTFAQALSNIFAGGNGDGWNGVNFVQAPSNIFAGGNGDGWNFTNFAQAGSNIFAGGISDGWSNIYYKPIVALPVKLVYFNAKKVDDFSALLSWKTSSETNSAHFEIERGTDALHFENIGKITAQVNSNEAFDYNFKDNNPQKGINYYRLKQVDFNGKYEYSPARAVNFENLEIGKVKYYPNPTKGILHIELDEKLDSDKKVINIFNSSGIVVEHFQLDEKSDSKIVLDLNKLPKGIYFINLIANGIKNTQKIVLD